MNIVRSASDYRSALIVAGFAGWMILDPAWNGILQSRHYLVAGIGSTVLYSVLGGASGFAAGGILAALRIAGGLPGICAALIVLISQGIPPLFVILAAYLVGPEVVHVQVSAQTAALVALALISSGYYCEALRGAFAGISRYQINAGTITGLPRMTILTRIVLPQALTACVPAVGAASIIVFKLSTLLYPIGVADFFRTVVLVNNRVIEPLRSYLLIAAFYYVAADLIQRFVARVSHYVSARASGLHGESNVSTAGLSVRPLSE